MTSLSTSLKREAIAPLTHILLSLDLLEAGTQSDEYRSYLTIIRKNVQRLQMLIVHPNGERITEHGNGSLQ